MVGDPIDPTPFEAAMPDAVRAAIASGRKGEGLVAPWLVARGRGWGQVGETTKLLRDARIDATLAGWLAGIAMFGDDTDRIGELLEGHAGARHAIDAFVAGVRANLATARGQWERVERLSAIGHAGLASIVPIGCTSEDAPTRAAAMRLARKLGGAAQAAVESARGSATGDAKRRLTAARKTLEPDGEDGDDGLLLRLLGGWRTSRARELEAALAEVGTEAAKSRGAITEKTREAIEAAWGEIAKKRDPRDVPRLLAAPWPKSLDAARRRVELFARFSPDPRIAMGVVVSARKHRSDSSLRFHRAVAELLLDVPMRALVAEIDAIVKTHDDPEIVEIYEDARALSESIAPTPAEPALLDELARRRTSRPDLDALWATHLAHPGDLAHRAVLGDALQVIGDPRGELISLQLSPSPTAATRKRIAELLAAHADTWSGPIPLVVKSARHFENGFITEMTCKGIGPELRATFDRPEWVTVEDLLIDGAGCALAPLIRRMPLLRHLATPHSDLLAQLARTGKYPSITAFACDRAWIPPRDAFPNARVAACRWARDDLAAALVAMRDLAIMGFTTATHLGVRIAQLPALIAARADGPPEQRFSLGDGGGGFGGTGGFAGFASPGWRIRIPRDERIAELAWGGGPTAYRAMKADLVTILGRAFLEIREVKRSDLR